MPSLPATDCLPRDYGGESESVSKQDTREPARPGIPGDDDDRIPPARRLPWRRVAALLLLLLVAFGAWHESRTSDLQSRIFARYASRLSYRFEPGPTDSVAYPVGGPFDLRRGYAFIPQVADTLAARNYAVTGQTRMSADLLKLTLHGVYAVYPTDARAGLEILDREERPLYALRFPERIYASFDSIPPVVVNTLLFIENRELLDERFPYRNPAVEWDRLAKATFDLALNTVGIDRPQAGGSTLATQMEKYRHAKRGPNFLPHRQAETDGGGESARLRAGAEHPPGAAGHRARLRELGSPGRPSRLR